MNYDNLDSITILVISCGVFVIFKEHPLKNQKLIKTVSKMSKYTFGTYLIHPLLLELADDYLNVSGITYNPFIFIPIYALIIFIIAGVLSFILSKIPFIRRVV